MVVHEILKDGRVRGVSQPSGGAWGGTQVDQAIVDYFCEIFTKEVIEVVKHEYSTEWINMMSQFEKIKRRITLEKKEEYVEIMLQGIPDTYQDVKGVNMKDDFNSAKARGANLIRRKLQIPKSVISKMIEKVAKKISAHTKDMLNEKGNENIDFIIMVGGFSTSPIVVQLVKDCVPPSIPVLVPEEPELAVVQGAVMYGWRPEIIKSRKSNKTYGINLIMEFRENIDPEDLVFYDGNNEKMCDNRFDKLITVGDEIEIDQTVKRVYRPPFHDSTEVIVAICTSEKSNVTYCNERGVSELGSIMIPMPDTTGGMSREVEITVCFGGTEIILSGKDLLTGARVQAVYDFL